MVKIVGRIEFLAKLEALASDEMVREVDQALFVGGNRVQTTAQRSITEGSVSGPLHIPSLPGEPPNADTHNLDRQIETEQVRPLLVHVTSNAEYAEMLESGTSKMAARPYMLPASEQEREAVLEGIRDAVNRVINGGSDTPILTGE